MAGKEKGTAVAPIKRARMFLQRDDVREQIAQAAVKGIDVDRLIKTALSVMTKNPRLLECSPASWALALQQAAELGLEPTGGLGRAYLIPYKNRGEYEAQFMIGARGLVELARRHPDIVDVDAQVVYEGDHFEYELGLKPNLVHKPRFHSGELPPMAAVYAVAYFTNGHAKFEVMNRAQIDDIRKRSKSKSEGPWVTDYNEMARKTVLRRLTKQLPLQVEVERAIERDDDVTGLDMSTSRAMEDLHRELLKEDPVDAEFEVEEETGGAPTEKSDSQPGLEF